MLIYFKGNYSDFTMIYKTTGSLTLRNCIIEKNGEIIENYEYSNSYSYFSLFFILLFISIIINRYSKTVDINQRFEILENKSEILIKIYKKRYIFINFILFNFMFLRDEFIDNFMFLKENGFRIKKKNKKNYLITNGKNSFKISL